MLRRIAVVFAVVFAAAWLFAGQLNAQAEPPVGAHAAESSNSFSRMMALDANGVPFEPPVFVLRSSSVLIRNKNGVAYIISTTGLTPGGAYTNWWIIFNHPEFCSPPGCGAPKDFPQNGGDPNVQASVVWATGRVADANGQATFSASLAADGTAPGQKLFGPALLNPRAEIHLVVRSHGPALTGDDLEKQLTTVSGGCSVNTCANVQGTRHLPQGEGE